MSKLCVYPWMHLHLHPTGQVLPCCMTDMHRLDRKKFGNLKKDNVSLLDAMNSEGMKEMRRTMMADGEHDACRICFDRERAGLDSMRLQMNEAYLHRYTQEIADTNKDGSIDDIRLNYVDLRFSNHCNLKCRTCGHELSSTWYEEHKDIIKRQNPDADTSDLQKFIRADEFDKIKPFLNTVDRMYWAGGEPLMEKQHYYTLEHLIDIGNAKDVHLSYNTNMSSITYKRKNITEWWKHFESITVAASIDGMDDVFEYIRTGAKWDKTRDNFNFLKFECPDLSLFIYPSVTVSILNIHQFPDFVQWCIDNRWIEGDFNLYTNFVTYPTLFSLKHFPPETKQEVADMLTRRRAEFIESGVQNAADAMQNCINFMYESDGNEKDWQHEMKYAKMRLDMFDETAGLDWKRSLPELAELLCNMDFGGAE